MTPEFSFSLDLGGRPSGNASGISSFSSPATSRLVSAYDPFGEVGSVGFDELAGRCLLGVAFGLPSGFVGGTVPGSAGLLVRGIESYLAVDDGLGMSGA